MSKFFDIFNKTKKTDKTGNKSPVEEKSESNAMHIDVNLTLTASIKDIKHEPELAEPSCSKNVIDMNSLLPNAKDTNKSYINSDLTDLGNLISGPIQPVLKV